MRLTIAASVAVLTASSLACSAEGNRRWEAEQARLLQIWEQVPTGEQAAVCDEYRSFNTRTLYEAVRSEFEATGDEESLPSIEAFGAFLGEVCD